MDELDKGFILSMVLIFIAAWAGGIATALTGFLGTTEKFDVRKFLTSVVKSFIGAGAITYSAYLAGIFNFGIIILSFLSGAGVEAGIKRITNAIEASIAAKTKTDT